MEPNTPAAPHQPPASSAFQPPQVSELHREDECRCQSFPDGETEAETGDTCLLAQEITAGLGGPTQGRISAPGASTLASGDVLPSASCAAV